MTGLEQSLAYVEREIGFMIKDDLGLATNGRYVDKVINDCLGFPNFGTGVYHSNKPNGIIFRAMNGTKGPQFMRFFNASLHDTRMDMVSVLVEADKFRLSNDSSSKSCRKYLIDLYGKSVKRMRKVIKVAKDESFKSMYKGLKNFAKFDEYEDDDDWDFGFSDVDFSGFEDLTPSYERGTGTILNHKSADEIMADITAEEARIGRKMTDTELDEFLSGPDDDNTPVYDDSKVNLGNIVRLVINELKASGSVGESEKPLESLEEFLVRNKAPEIDSVVPNSVDVEVPHHDVVDVPEKPEKSELENLVGMYNHSEKRSYEGPKIEEVSSDDNEESSEESDSDEESSAVPPISEMGGTESSLDVDSGWDDPHLYDSDGRFTAVTEEEVDNMFNQLLEAATKKAPPKGVDIQASIRKLEAQKAANPELVVECNTKDMERFIREMKEKQSKEEENKKSQQGKRKSRRERRKEERERRNAEIRKAKATATSFIPPITEDEKVPILPPSFKKIEEEIDQPLQLEMTADPPSEVPAPTNKSVNPELEHAMLVEDILSDFDSVLQLKNELKFQMNNFCNSMGVHVNGMDIDITPSSVAESYRLYDINIIVYSLEDTSRLKSNIDKLCSNFRDKVADALSIDNDKILIDVKCVMPSHVKDDEIGANTPRVTPPELFESFSPASLLFADDDSDEFHKEEDEENE